MFFPGPPLRRVAPILLAATAAFASAPSRGQPPAAAPTPAVSGAAQVIDGVRQAAAAYVASFNAGDEKALATHWTAGAELEEGAGMLKGRDAIVASLVQG